MATEMTEPVMVPVIDEDTYFDLADVATLLVDSVPGQWVPSSRARVMGAVAAVETAMAAVCEPVFGPCPNPIEGDRDNADALTISALVWAAFAEVEYARAGEDRPRSTGAVEEAIGDLLDELSARYDYPYDLFDRIATALVPVAGPRSVDAVWAVYQALTTNPWNARESA